MEQVWQSMYDKFAISQTITLPDENSSLLDIYDRSMQLFADRTAFIHQNHRLSYAQLDRYSLALAKYLQSLELEQGSRIALMMPNCLQYYVAVMGVIRAGHIVVNVNPLYTARELAHQLNDSHAQGIILIQSAVDTLAEIQQETSIRHIFTTQLDDFYSELSQAATTDDGIQVGELAAISLPQAIVTAEHFNYQRPNLKLHDTCVLQYTGGTTGVSKGTELSHANLIANILQCDEMFKNELGGLGATEPNYPHLCAIPLYHIFAFTVCALFGLYKGQANILVSNPRDLPVLIDAIEQHKPALFPSVNTLYHALVHNERFQQLDHSSLRIAMGGGMPVLPATAEKWQQITGLTILEAYGLSETSPVATCNPTQHRHFSGMIGIPVPSTDVAILDDDGNIIPAGAVDDDGEPIAGEIAIRGPQVMKGYWNRPDETAKVMTADGFFRSGDIGIMDKDGFAKIVDRKKDMILVSGFNVYPTEIEQVVTHHAKVLEAAAIGVFDEHSGEVPKLFVVKKDDSLTAEEILSYARQHLTGYKVPKYVEFIAELPKSNVGKILRKNLRDA
ncbi:MAG: AMP-binding protein [Acinetobacter sp.]|nr:AMP-binding protein [Acinetobacter sp.]